MSTLLVALALLAIDLPDGGSLNRPPELQGMSETWSCPVGATCQIEIHAFDPDGDPLTISTTPLPSGAVVHPDPGSVHLARTKSGSHQHFVIQFKPSADQTGDHPITITASDGQAIATHEGTIEVTEEWEAYAMPGVSALSYVPRSTVESGGYLGASVECLVASWAHRNNKHGPSHGRVYLDLDLLFPLSGRGGNLYAYTAGADLTIERNPSRRFLIPYFGAEVGGVHSALLGDYFVVVPYGGIHLWSDRTVWVDVSAGYVLPGRDLDQLSGAWTKAGLNLSFW